MSTLARLYTKRALNPCVAKAFSYATLFQYNASALKADQGVNHIAVAADGVRVAGEYTLVMLGSLPDRGVSSVLPPQVPSMAHIP